MDKNLEAEKIAYRKGYNNALDTAIFIVSEGMDYEDRILGKDETLICALENSKYREND
jgi:hypothetical protein